MNVIKQNGGGKRGIQSFLITNKQSKLPALCGLPFFSPAKQLNYLLIASQVYPEKSTSDRLQPNFILAAKVKMWMRNDHYLLLFYY